ncbi:GntR family transcriptional regulator [Nocardia sp. 004]|uniref:GntR family transcriptional regulator n=1 Tax=Nocardia sp. 004 TaxID=3385978 RepID=UPI0039A1B8C3
MEPRTVVADVADELARRITAGDYQPGKLVPSVRQVAEEFEMNRATAQLVLGRLESYGFVEAERGKGFAIRDVWETGGVDVYRRLFRFSIPMPDTAIEMFRDIVEVERTLVLHALLRYTSSAPPIAPPAELKAGIGELELAAGQAVPDLRQILHIEIMLVRRMLTALGLPMQRAMLNSIGEMVLEVPEAVAAFFPSAPGLHALLWRALAAVWDSGAGPTEAQLDLFENLFDAYHQRVITRFTELVGGVGERVGEPCAATA